MAAAIATLGCGASAAAPLRLGIPVANVNGGADSLSLPEEFTQLTAQLLRERAAGRPSLALVSPARCDAIAREISGGLRRRPGDPLAEFRRFQPVDAVAWWTLDGEHQVEVLVCTDSGTATALIDGRALLTNPQAPPSHGLPELARQTVDVVAAKLPIPEADRTALAGGEPLGLDVLTVSRSRCVAEQGLDELLVEGNSDAGHGIGPLLTLLSQWKLDRPNPPLAAEVVRVAYTALASHAEQTPAGLRTRPAWLTERARERWTVLVKSCFLEVLGTPAEPLARRLAVVAPSLFATETLDLARPLFVDFTIEKAIEADAAAGANLDAGLDIGGLDAGLDAPTPPFAGAAPGTTKPKAQGGLAATKAPRAQRLGAVRMLGPLGTPEAVEMLVAALGDRDAEIRLAAAFSAATAEPPPPAILPKIEPLVAGADPAIAFLAALALERAGRDSPRLLPLARTVAAGDSLAADEAARVVVRMATADDAALLRSIADRRAAVRADAVRAIQRLGAADAAAIGAWLGSTDEAVVAAALDGLLEAPQAESLEERLLALADDPFQPIAAASRAVLRRHLPADPWRRREAALQAEHPFVRERILEDIAADADSRAAALLEKACGNRDAQVRVVALRILADRDAAAARARLPAALVDENEWAAFHAAVLAPRLATADLLPALEAAAKRPLGTAAQLHLDEAIAKAKGEPVPTPRPAARPLVHPDGRSYAWGTTPGLYATESPFEAYYCLDTQRIDLLTKASAAGKVLVARAAPIRAPARLVLDPATRDGLIPKLDAELYDRAAAVIDGVVYGEETLDFPTDELWPEAWPLFCRDAGLDETKVAGVLDNLNPFERRAWQDWTHRLHVRGYNLLHDLTKLRAGKLRPGLAVGTFQPLGPEQKNDFLGIYDYKGDNRLCAYDLVRSMKTAYPGLPVLWFSLGIGGYEMNPVRDTDAPATGPLFDSWGRAWSDAVTAWLAGAETGWFSAWLFVSPEKGRTDSGMASLRGKIVWVDDIGPKSPVLDEAIKWSFKHVTKSRPDSGPPTEVRDADASLDDLLGDADAKREEARAQLEADVAARKAALNLGFQYYRQHVYDCARIVASLPRPAHEPQGLVVRGNVSVWTRPETAYPLVPAAALLSRYDALTDFNSLARLDLSARRLVVVHAPTLLSDDAIRHVDAWLRDTPGLLVVHRDLPAADDAEASTIEDHDGKLEADWPWEADVACAPVEVRPGKGDAPIELDSGGRPLRLASGHVGAHFTLTGTAAASLASAGGRTVLAVWTKPGYRGAVLFDGMQFTSGEYLTALRQVINDLHRTRGVGATIEGPALLETLAQGSLRAAAATRYYQETKDAVQVPGLDLLTGDRDSAVGRLVGSVSSVTAAGHAAGHVAATPTLVAVAEKPFAAARIEGESLALEAAGVIRIASATGAIEVTAGGKPLAVTRVVNHGTDTAKIGSDGLGHWLFANTTTGLWEMRRGAGAVWYLRSQAPVVIRPVAKQAASPPDDPADVAAREAAAAREAKQAAPQAAAIDLDLGDGMNLPLVRVEAIDGWVGRFEVTNDQFRRFRADHASGPGADAPRQPAVNVSHADATAFARWVTEQARGLPPGTAARLPRGEEWLTIARCGDDREYPWGDAWPPTRGNYDDRPRTGGGPVGTYRDGWPAACVVEASGRNEWGLFGFGGNVWEWTDEPDAAAAGWAIRRGGAWTWELWGQEGTPYAQDLRCDHRSYAFPDLRNAATGFRIVVTAK